ncbi:MAG: acyl-CoA thioesterase [Verrucomicrobiota bacterium]
MTVVAMARRDHSARLTGVSFAFLVLVMSSSPKAPFHPLLWGNTISLSWMWGLGLFFSVQFTVQFGIAGLLAFAIPNAVGLFLFGLVTQRVANRGSGSEALAHFFEKWSVPFRLPLVLYQFAAIALTIFAIACYLLQPLGLSPAILYLSLGVLILLAATFLFGEEFGIARIKWSHAVMMGIALIGVILILSDYRPALFSVERPFAGETGLGNLPFYGFIIPMSVGLLVGPWMDLQQWQRAIQIHREGGSVVRSYAIGSSLFFLLLILHGGLAHWALTQGANQFVRSGLLDFAYGHQILTQFFYSQVQAHPLAFGGYVAFICVCILTTLDSAYIALRWFFIQNAAKSQSVLYSLLPPKLLTSPIPVFVLAGAVAAVCLTVRLEIEYFMVLYGSFFVAYSLLGLLRTLRGKTDPDLAQVTLFCIGTVSLAILSFGYLQQLPAFMILGGLVPLAYILYLIMVSQTEPQLKEALVPVGSDAAPEVVTSVEPALPAGAELAIGTSTAPSAGHFEGKSFVHSFLATYADTNSVGNVYFGMYAMWVGKTRELFFNQVLPDFDLKTTEYFILTRSFEHKFIREAREFENIRVELRIGEHNRKFATLEHRVLDGANKVLGKGKQSLMFVAQNDYSLIDIPAEVHTAFIPYAP